MSTSGWMHWSYIGHKTPIAETEASPLFTQRTVLTAPLGNIYMLMTRCFQSIMQYKTTEKPDQQTICHPITPIPEATSRPEKKQQSTSKPSCQYPTYHIWYLWWWATPSSLQTSWNWNEHFNIHFKTISDSHLKQHTPGPFQTII